jgi:hypothetical protein
LQQLQLQALVMPAGQMAQRWQVRQIQHMHHLILLLLEGTMLQQQQADQQQQQVQQQVQQQQVEGL